MTDIKHFESLWEDAERAAKDYCKEFNLDETKIVELIEKNIHNLVEGGQDKGYSFGLALFFMCAASEKFQLNSYAALQKSVQDMKTLILESQNM